MRDTFVKHFLWDTLVLSERLLYIVKYLIFGYPSHLDLCPSSGHFRRKTKVTTSTSPQGKPEKNLSISILVQRLSLVSSPHLVPKLLSSVHVVGENGSRRRRTRSDSTANQPSPSFPLQASCSTVLHSTRFSTMFIQSKLHWFNTCSGPCINQTMSTSLSMVFVEPVNDTPPPSP